VAVAHLTRFKLASISLCLFILLSSTLSTQIAMADGQPIFQIEGSNVVKVNDGADPFYNGGSWKAEIIDSKSQYFTITSDRPGRWWGLNFFTGNSDINSTIKKGEKYGTVNALVEVTEVNASKLVYKVTPFCDTKSLAWPGSTASLFTTWFEDSTSQRTAGSSPQLPLISLVVSIRDVMPSDGRSCVSFKVSPSAPSLNEGESKKFTITTNRPGVWKPDDDSDGIKVVNSTTTSLSFLATGKYPKNMSFSTNFQPSDCAICKSLQFNVPIVVKNNRTISFSWSWADGSTSLKRYFSQKKRASLQWKVNYVEKDSRGKLVEPRYWSGSTKVITQIKNANGTWSDFSAGVTLTGSAQFEPSFSDGKPQVFSLLAQHNGPGNPWDQDCKYTLCPGTYQIRLVAVYSDYRTSAQSSNKIITPSMTIILTGQFSTGTTNKSPEITNNKSSKPQYLVVPSWHGQTEKSIKQFIFSSKQKIFLSFTTAPGYTRSGNCRVQQNGVVVDQIPKAGTKMKIGANGYVTISLFLDC